MQQALDPDGNPATGGTPQPVTDLDVLIAELRRIASLGLYGCIDAIVLQAADALEAKAQGAMIGLYALIWWQFGRSHERQALTWPEVEEQLERLDRAGVHNWSLTPCR